VQQPWQSYKGLLTAVIVWGVRTCISPCLPQPVFAWCEALTGFPIASRIVCVVLQHHLLLPQSCQHRLCTRSRLLKTCSADHNLVLIGIKVAGCVTDSVTYTILCLIGIRGGGRSVTSKAQVAGEVAAAAPLAAFLPPSNAAQSAPPAASQPPSNAQAEGKAALSALPGLASKGQTGVSSPGTADVLDGLPSPLNKASKRQKDANDKAAEGKAQLEGVAKLANELQPTGSTLSTMQVHTKVCHSLFACVQLLA